MRERGDVGKAEHTRAALDRVCHTEYRVYTFRIGRTDIQLEERGFHAVERLKALFEEGIVELREIEFCHGSSQFGSKARSSASVNPSEWAARRSAALHPVHSTRRASARKSRTNAASSC